MEKCQYILLYDMHYAGDCELNIELEKLPPNVRLVDLPNREGSFNDRTAK